jgi:hypothetical protein
MRRIAGFALALAGLAAFLGAEKAEDGRKVFIVYSADERSELAPCG